jgi:hypothetical protein
MSEIITTQKKINIANGIFTVDILNKEDAFKEKCLNNGVSELALLFLHHTSVPKGHPDYMSETNAMKEFFPNTTIGTARNRAFKAAQRIYMLLFHGQKEEECLTYYKKTHKQPIFWMSRKTPDEIKAEILTKKQLMRKFRELKGAGIRGRLINEEKAEACAFIKEHYNKTFSKILSEIKNNLTVIPRIKMGNIPSNPKIRTR